MAARIHFSVSGRLASLEAGTLLLAWLAATAGTAAAAPPAQDGSPDPQHGEVLYLRHCVPCHGARAWGDGPREIPALAGQRETYLIEQLTRFASDARPGSVMHGPAMHDTLTASQSSGGDARSCRVSRARACRPRARTGTGPLPGGRKERLSQGVCRVSRRGRRGGRRRVGAAHRRAALPLCAYAAAGVRCRARWTCRGTRIVGRRAAGAGRLRRAIAIWRERALGARPRRSHQRLCSRGRRG